MKPTLNPSVHSSDAGSTTVSGKPVRTTSVHGAHTGNTPNASHAQDVSLQQQDASLQQTEQTLQQMRMRLAEASGQVQNTGWLIELMQSLASQDDFSAACHELTSQLQSHMNLVRVAIGWKGDASRQAVMSITGVSQQDPTSEEVRQVQGCLDESITRESLGCWPAIASRAASQAVSVDTLLSHKQIAGRDREVVSMPLTSKDGKTLGSLMLVATRGQLTSHPQAMAFITAASAPLADILAGCRRAEGTRLTKLVQWYQSRPIARRAVTIGVVVAAIASAWIPMPYQIACSSVIEPVERRFCVAPHDGLLQQAEVEAGDVVTVGQTIASMDGREVRLELAGLVAQHRRATKQHDAYLAAHKTTDALQAELEIERLQSQIDLLRHRENHQTIRSPIAGIVLAGSMDRRENFPVEQGQVLYEIAPLDQLRVELSVAGADVSHIAEGMPVEIMFAGFGNETFEATVAKIRPQSEVRDDQNVFVAECLLANHDGRIRPGMKGHAKIKGKEHALGWIALHRAWEQVCVRMPW